MLNDFPRHVHNDCCAGIITAGERRMTIAGFDYFFGIGDIFIINPGEPHTFLPVGAQPHSYAVLMMPCTLIDSIALDICAADMKPVFRNRISDSSAAERFRGFLEMLDKSDVSLEGETLFYSFIEYCTRYHSDAKSDRPAGEPDNSICRARLYIEDNYKEAITLEDLSDYTGVSPFHLNRIFSCKTGMSPHAYHIHRRIEKSKRLLLEGYPIAYVSVESGFTDQAHYTRFFKMITGTTPGRFVLYNVNRPLQKEMTL